jgi:hypothetical protein
MMTRTIPVLIASLVGILLVVAFFVPALLPARQIAEEWFTIVAAIAIIFGGISIVIHHLKKINDREAGWGFSGVLLVAMLTTISLGIFKVGIIPDSAQHMSHPWSGPILQEGGAFWWIYVYLQSPVVSMMFALLAFYVASAAFRAFRAKNIEAILLLITALIVLIGQTKDGELLAISLGGDSTSVQASTNDAQPPSNNAPKPIYPIKVATEFIRTTIVTAGQRAIMIGISLGVVATSMRMILGIDRSYLGGDE